MKLRIKNLNLPPVPRQTPIFVAVLVGALLGMGLQNAALRSNLKLPFNLQKSLSSTPITTQNQVIVNEENAIIDVVEKSSPSVVAIAINNQPVVFDPFNPVSGLGPQQQQSTIGTGFVVSSKGVVVTNKHVVANTNAHYTVIFKDGKKYDVKKLYRDPLLDLALVQIEATDLQPLPLGDSSQLKVGQTVIAIGNALGKFTNTVTSGIVSGVGRRVQAGDPFSGAAENLDNLIQTDAAINPGNSGGPLLNSAGQVIGVDVATTEGAQNIGFAVPINSVTKIVDQFVQNGVVSRPFLGIRYRFVAKDLAILNNVPQGAYIQEVVSGSGADKAGLQAGDIITKVDTQAIDSDTTISEVIATKKTGDSLNIEYFRDNKSKTVTATLLDAPNQ